MRVLVVEDSVRLADTLRDAFIKENITADVVNDGKSGYENAVSGIYDIVILDLMLPQMNGYEVLEAIRREDSDVPILVLSAKTELEDKLKAFRAGADDYVTKPFAIEELVMRIKAITRRRGKKEIVSLKAGKLMLDTTTCQIKNRESGKTMQIAGKEMQLLELFLLNRN